MISFQSPFLLSSKKRKWEEPNSHSDQQQPFFEMRPLETACPRSSADSLLDIETPLPFDWQRCLDIQSGQINFYNTRTQKRTCMDPRKSTSSTPDSTCSPKTSTPDHMSLDLELNLTCNSVSKIHPEDDNTNCRYSKNSTSFSYKSLTANCRPSWLAAPFEADRDDDREDQEQIMVTAVCKRCHMLVMLCKSSPSCPNCKFMHPSLDQSPPSLFKSHYHHHHHAARVSKLDNQRDHQVLSSSAATLSKDQGMATCANKNQSLVLSLG